MTLATVHLHAALVSVVLWSIASAACYGGGAALQHHATGRDGEASSVGRLLRLGLRPTWLLGSALDGCGYLFQFLALRRGSLALVEPILVLSLVFALPIAAAFERRRVASSELVSSAVTVAGLSLFLGVAQPALGHPAASPAAWASLSAAVVVGCSILAVFARRSPTTRRAVLYAAASGAAFGYVAAVTERTGHVLDRGVLHVFVTWVPYALVVAAIGALVLTQCAFSAGVLKLSLPTLTIAQPIVALAIGIGFFGEHVDSSGAAPIAEILGLLTMIVGAFWLSRSPALAEHGGDAGGYGRAE